VYQQTATAAAMVRLGVAWNRARLYNPHDPLEVSDVVITGNTFDKPFVGIADGELPIDHCRDRHDLAGYQLNRHQWNRPMWPAVSHR